MGRISVGDNSTVAWVGKYSGEGERLWTEVGPSGEREFALSVATSDDGDVLVGGRSSVRGPRQPFGSPDFEPRRLLRAYGADGGERWTRIDLVSGSASADGLVPDPEGGFYMASGLGLAKLDRRGSIEWETDFDGTFVRELSAVHEGRIAVVVTTIDEALDRIPWVLVATSSGVELWRRRVTVSPVGVAFDSAGNVVMAAGTISSTWIQRFSSDGESMSEVDVPVSGLHLRGMAVDAEDRVLLTGTIDRGTGGYRVWAGRSSDDGVLDWTWSLDDDPRSSWGCCVAVDEEGAAFVGAQLDASSLGGNGDRDIWIGRLAP